MNTLGRIYLPLGTYLDPKPRAPCLQIIPTLDPKVYEYDLHWAIWSLRANLFTMIACFWPLVMNFAEFRTVQVPIICSRIYGFRVLGLGLGRRVLGS